jgi:bifunctional non-homologous end joining protein LigD
MEREGPPPLELYRRKRDPERTPEPFGGRRPSGPGAGGLFVIQKHAARRLHYDLRLEMDGVLKSWAVPRGPSVRAEEKRLAVHVEDHPLEYGDFEGVIPAGNYGAGAVIVWDQGRWRPVKPDEPLRQLERGRIEVELAGHKLRGRWTLARMGGAGRATGNEWLLLRKAPGAEGPEPTERYPESVLSGLTVEEMARPGARLARIRERLAALRAPAREVGARGQPFMLATLEERPFSDPAWLYELKYDGVRMMAERRGDEVALYGRSGDVITARYPEIAAALARLPAERFVVDGEIVAADEEGRPSFQRLQGRMHLTSPRDVARAVSAIPVTAVLFDCLALDGHDLRRLPLRERKACLALLAPPLGTVRYGDHVAGRGEDFFQAVDEQGLEGVVAKRADSPYSGGRSRAWIKLKCRRRVPLVIGGYTTGQGGRAELGALHVGRYDRPPGQGGRLVYVGKVGTGLDGATIRGLLERLRPLARAAPPFATGAPAGRGHHWVEPRLVCEVRYTEWTAEGGLRHPSFLGLRPDLAPEACVAGPGSPAAAPVPAAAAPEERAAPPAPAGDPPPAVKVTNAAKVFWPAEGHTKGDLVAYYEAVAPWLLRYLRDRPLVLTRYPDGIAGKSFFQKDAPAFVPDWVRTERIWSRDSGREIDYFVVNDVPTLRYVVNLGTIPLHLWASRLAALDRPDWLVLDLDPKGAPFTDVVRVARRLHRLLEELELPSYPKTSGATGLHVLLPLGARYSYEQARTFARLLATLAVDAEPGIATVARPLRARGGKVYVDWGQNGHGQTIVAPFSARPLPGAPASCPLRWSEVTARLDPTRYTITTLPARAARLGDPLAPVLDGPGIDMAAAVARIEARRRR